MNILYKLIIVFIKNSSVFSLPYLRNFRWYLYRNYYKTGKLYVDEGVTIVNAHISDKSHFFCGDHVHVGKGVYIDTSGGVFIEGEMSISEGVKIYTHNHDVNGFNKDWKKNDIVFSSLKIEKYSWLGSQVLVLPNVNVISEGSVVAAGSVLTKNTEPYAIYAGNPARKISERNVDEV